MNSACFLTNYASAFSYSPTRDIDSGSDRVGYKVLTNLYRNQKYFQDNTTFEVNIMANYAGKHSFTLVANVRPKRIRLFQFFFRLGVHRLLVLIYIAAYVKNNLIFIWM